MKKILYFLKYIFNKKRCDIPAPTGKEIQEQYKYYKEHLYCSYKD